MRRHVFLRSTRRFLRVLGVENAECLVTALPMQHKSMRGAELVTHDEKGEEPDTTWTALCSTFYGPREKQRDGKKSSKIGKGKRVSALYGGTSCHPSYIALCYWCAGNVRVYLEECRAAASPQGETKHGGWNLCSLMLSANKDAQTFERQPSYYRCRRPVSLHVNILFYH